MAEASSNSLSSLGVFLDQGGGAGFQASAFPHALDTAEYLFTDTYYSVDVNAETGRNLNPPVLFTKSDQPAVLKIDTDITVVTPLSSVLILWATNSPTYGPMVAGNVFDDTDFMLVADIDMPDDGWELQGDGTYSYVYNWNYEDLKTLDSVGPGDDILVDYYSKVRDVLWDGNSGIAVSTEIPGGVFSVTGITYTGWSVPFNTGWLGYPAERGRPVWDHISGLPTFAQDCQESGYYPGLWTEPKTWDAEEPMNIQPVELPDTEGEIDDDFPQ